MPRAAIGVAAGASIEGAGYHDDDTVLTYARAGTSRPPKQQTVCRLIYLRLLFYLVAATGLEPVLPKIRKQILSLLCLPFHHAAKWALLAFPEAYVASMSHSGVRQTP